MRMEWHWVEFLSLMAAFGVSAVAPGPDFAMVLRQSIAHGRSAAMVTSAGIASAILVHGTYTLLGIGLIVSQSILLFDVLKWIGAAYLFWLGINALRSPAPKEPVQLDDAPKREMTWQIAYALGFLTNLLNPKAVLFFLALFTTVVSAQTAMPNKVIYVGCMSAMLFGWFALVSFFFTTPAIRRGFYAMGKWFNRVTGAALMLLAVKVAVARQH